MALQHLRSSTADKRPTPAAMSDGQLALNTNLASPGLFFKDSNGDSVKIGPVHVGTTAPNVTPGAGGQAGNSKGEAWLDTTAANPILKVWNGSAFVAVQPVGTGTVVSTTDSGTVTSTMILDGTILNADINASAAIVDTKLATISTAGKVSNSATTATNANTASAIVARDASGNFAAGDITISDKIIHDGDTNTAIRFPAADTVTIETAGSERLRIDSSGRLLVGTSSEYFTPLSASTAPLSQIHSASKSSGQLLIGSWSTGTDTGPSLSLCRADSGTVGTYSPAIGSSDVLGNIRFNGSDGVKFIEGATITASADGTWGTDDGPTNLVFSTTADGASSPTERMCIDSSGRLLHGTSTAAVTVSISGTSSTPSFQHAGTGQAGSSAGLFNWSTSASAAYLNFSKSKSGTIDARGQVASGNDLGSVLFAGDDGTNFVISAGIVAQVDGTPGTDNMPGRLVFRTKAAGATGTPAERMRITSAGNVGIGTVNPGSALQVEGLITGTAVVSSDTDITAGRLLTTAAGPKQAFRRANILGAVSQSGGVPTGAIIEEGSNANGNFTKYANGTVIMSMRRGESRAESGVVTTNVTLPLTLSENISDGPGSVTATLNSAAPQTATSISVTDTDSTTDIDVKILRSNSTNTNFYVTLVGRWF
jgi:hypothetical protein